MPSDRRKYLRSPGRKSNQPRVCQLPDMFLYRTRSETGNLQLLVNSNSPVVDLFALPCDQQWEPQDYVYPTVLHRKIEGRVLANIGEHDGRRFVRNVLLLP